MDHLLRPLAPVSDVAWDLIEAEATRTVRHYLAGRSLIGVTGPLGWEHGGPTTGRLQVELPQLAEGVDGGLRAVRPLVELRTPFEVPRDELDAADRGAPDPDLSAVIDASRRAALAEDRAVFHGCEPAGIAGMLAGSPHAPVPISEDYDEYPGIVAGAVATLRAAGVGGPYAVALGARCYSGVIETTEQGGYPVLEHIRLIVGGPVAWAPAIDGAAVVSLRGGDYELVCGQDFSIGYRSHSEAEERRPAAEADREPADGHVDRTRAHRRG
jgi:uncharacterized linocin/CFP29 family protein